MLLIGESVDLATKSNHQEDNEKNPDKIIKKLLMK